MLNLAAAVPLSIANLVYAAIIYLSLHGWLVAHEPSGMRLFMHLIVTAPMVLITTAWFFYLARQEKCSTIFWKINLAGILIPVMSVQTGVTHYHFDKVGLAISVLVVAGIFVLFIGGCGGMYIANKARHSDGFSVAASPPLQSRACWRR